MSEIFYKVVREIPKIQRLSRYREFFSLFSHFPITYFIGRTTVPRDTADDNLLFAYTNLGAARRAAAGTQGMNTKIFVCSGSPHTYIGGDVAMLSAVTLITEVW